MKIRIKGNSVRLRLTKSEVKEFSETGKYADSTTFGLGVFKYALVAKEGISTLEATYQANTLTVFIPAAAKNTWYESDRISYANNVALNTNELSILVEKDFTCMDNRAEDQSDNYPNPKA